MQSMFKTVFFTLLCFCYSKLSYSTTLKFVAEDLPPFHFYDENNQAKGVLIDVVKAVMNKTNIPYQIELLPFARSYDLTSKEKNTFMFSLMQSNERKENFQWIGRTYKSTAFLIGLHSRRDIDINSLEQAKSHVVGTIRGYYSEKYLKYAGFSTKKNLHLSVNYKHMWSMLFNQRIDFILTNFVAIDREMKSIGLNKKDIKAVIPLNDFPGDLFIATGKKTPNQTVIELSKALKEIKANGTYQNIIKKWDL